jgi:hypothetical protein
MEVVVVLPGSESNLGVTLEREACPTLNVGFVVPGLALGQAGKAATFGLHPRHRSAIGVGYRDRASD